MGKGTGKMRILILNPSFGKDFVRSARWAARSRGRVQRHPDYLAIATAVLEEAGHEVKLLDAAALNIFPEEVKQIASDFKPELSAIHTTTPSIYSDIQHAEMLKDLGSTTILFGLHVSALPEETIRMSRKVDYVARGEYDYILRDIASHLSPAEIRGITYWKNSTVISNANRPYIQNLDELPFPAWHQVDIHKYFDAGKLYPFITIISGRGCPNNCSFCTLPQVLYGKRYRLRSAGKVVDEIEHDLRLFPDLKEIMFEDDTITADRKRCADVCKEIISRNLNICWSANARADLEDLELLQLMKKAGCRMLVVGFEFGNQQILDNVHKRLTLEHMRNFARLTKEVGILVHGCFMIGGIGETRETAKQTINLAKELKPDTLQFSAMTPYPGTEFYQWCKTNNYIIAKDWINWIDEAGEQTAIIEYPDLPQKEIVSLVDKGLYKSFYFTPGVWIHHLLSIRSFDDLKRKIRGAKGLADYWQTKYINMKRVFRFAVTGGLAGALGFSAICLMVEKLGINYLAANALGFAISASTGYLGNWLWTFKEKGKKLLYKQLSYPMYLAMCAINLSIVMLLTYTLVQVFQFHYLLAAFIAGLLLIPTNYLISKIWIFRKAKA